MTDQTDNTSQPDHSRQELADQRTDMAEDRTVMANERTFAGWMRTGLAAVGIGIGFNALFESMEPAWLPKAIATCFILAGLIVVYLAERSACRVLQRLNAHQAVPLSGVNLRLVAAMVALGAVALLVGIWWLV